MSLISENKLSDAILHIKNIFYKYFDNYTNSNNAISNFKYIYDQFKIIDNINELKIKPPNESYISITCNGYIQLHLLIDYMINSQLNILTTSIKQNLSDNLYEFITSIEGIIWFLTNDINLKNNFYQTKLSYIGGEKYRKLFFQTNINNFINLINILKNKNKK